MADGHAFYVSETAIQYKNTHPPDQRRRLNAGTFREAWKIEESDYVPVYQMTKMPEPRKMKMMQPEEFAQMIACPFKAEPCPA